MSKWFSRSMLALSLPVVVTIVAPMTAHADDVSVTITVNATGILLDRTLVRVPAEITCAPLEVRTNQGGANLRQAVSGRIAFGQGFNENPIICDGMPHTNSYLVWVDTASPAPFRQGNATIQISAFLCSPTFVCESGGSGIQVIRLRR
ncbi:hypothetical protein [Actinocrispum sp. NPDC049592]|uniref:hypothetical protein n=1 Tax=Actinocrispum sp. NPDC049592 TaxID=3154835 RepID=UPI00344A7BF5